MTLQEIIPLFNSICWFLSIFFIIKMSRNQFDYIKSIHDYVKAVDKGTREIDAAFRGCLDNMEGRITYLHKVFFTNRQTVSTKIELLESEIHAIHNLLGLSPGQMMYTSKDVAERRDDNEGMESRE